MAYRLLADVVMALHFAFLVYVIAGGFLAWYRPVAIWPHLLLAGWGFLTIVFGLHCPLTYLEDQARQRAGQSGLRAGFIDHYLTGVVYPVKYLPLLQVLAATVVLVSWIGALLLRRRRHPARHSPGPGGSLTRHDRGSGESSRSARRPPRRRPYGVRRCGWKSHSG